MHGALFNLAIIRMKVERETCADNKERDEEETIEAVRETYVTDG